ncbi:TetR/AcrR family transcriptional regulator [Gloeobacter kilaueensis]|uniref:TetR family transcriptional regulator n=1 Tax=Gloeobacter kilaueensis (strain ATCC BAA-2537 / CCAP 1431/1 / ULC 316 / JS1) TaxID=1183438 RepID=U5QHA1_GLOK1|nr:TetR/AcrR family transcriptional regulator [Gloeobacter kilaueensis]AGY57040.1 TetR family transcriptional regulator [Gloeobacter kilaueensis JS1]
MSNAQRPYRQVARAAAAQNLRQRIVMAFHDQMLTRWIDEITLDEVAAAAGTTRRTVIRLFGGKEGLLDSVITLVWDKATPRLALPSDATLETALGALLAQYESGGDMTIRFIAQEGRHPLLREPLNQGRRNHRAWVAAHFGNAVGSLEELERERQIARLVVATDVYTWKLLRRDLGYAPEDVSVLIAGMITRIVGASLLIVGMITRIIGGITQCRTIG